MAYMASRRTVKSEKTSEDGLHDHHNTSARTGNDSDLSPFMRLILSLVRLVQGFAAQALGFLASRLAPVVIFISLIPVLLVLSSVAGLYVWRSIATDWAVPLYLQYGEGTSPYAEVALPGLSPYQHYDFSLHLVVPALEENYALGNFMTSFTLSTPSNRSIAFVRKPAIILRPAKSRFGFWSSDPSLLNLEILLIESFVPGTSQVIARVDVGRRDGWSSLGRGEGRELTVLGADLRGFVRRKGLRGFIVRYPITFSLATSVAFMTVSTLVLVASMAPVMQKRLLAHNAATEAPQLAERSPKPTPRRTPPKDQARRRSWSIDPKTEGGIEVPPASSATSTTLRRRRSGLLFTES